jgi:hypothetical protein
VGEAMKFGERRRRIQIVAEGLFHPRRDFAAGLCVADSVIPAVERALGLFERVDRPVDRLPVMGAQHRQPQDLAGPFAPAEPGRAQQFVNGDEVAEALRHLLAFDLQKAVVHPYVGHPRGAEGAA